ncbi:MAG: hypothetical protein M3Y18_03970 [Candidatus Eremiobacteraeota bacterium]|nr:hypothetical protein [Candidatus Eremiobacteraeota bacterium]
MNRHGFLASTTAAGLLGARGLAASMTGPASGRTIYADLPAVAPFPHPSRAQGHAYQGRLFSASASYNDSTVGIFIPPGFRPSAATDFVVHFHGWNNDVRGVFARYRLREQLAESGRNAILVVPQGPKDAPDSGDGKLELEPGGFARFMAAALGAVRGTEPHAGALGSIVITAHSGGYGGAGGALARGGMADRVSDVILFDSAYGYFDAFAEWAKSGQNRRLLSMFTNDTSTGNAALMGKLQAAHPNLYILLSENMTPQNVHTRSHTFILTTVAHDELMQKFDWYAFFLRASALR